MFSLPRLGPTVLSSTNFIGAARAPALNSKASSLASCGEPTPVILKLVPRTAWMVARLIIFFSIYDVWSIMLLPFASVISSDLLFCSTNKTASLLPIFPDVAFCIALPPCISSVIFTCDKPLSSKPVLAFVTLSPVTTTAFSKDAVAYSLSLKLNSSFLNGDVLEFASSRNSKFAVLPIIFFAAVGS